MLINADTRVPVAVMILTWFRIAVAVPGTGRAGSATLDLTRAITNPASMRGFGDPDTEPSGRGRFLGHDEAQHVLFGCLRSAANPGNTAVSHHHNAVRDCEHMVEIVTDHD